MLREKTGPVLPISCDFRTTYAFDSPHLHCGFHSGNCLAALVDDAWITKVQADAQLENTSRARREATIPQVHPEQVRVLVSI
jgi:hypothetical protein